MGINSAIAPFGIESGLWKTPHEQAIEQT